jgi:hypothetical protein
MGNVPYRLGITMMKSEVTNRQCILNDQGYRFILRPTVDTAGPHDGNLSSGSLYERLSQLL